MLACVGLRTDWVHATVGLSCARRVEMGQGWRRGESGGCGGDCERALCTSLSRLICPRNIYSFSNSHKPQKAGKLNEIKVLPFSQGIVSIK